MKANDHNPLVFSYQLHVGAISLLGAVGVITLFSDEYHSASYLGQTPRLRPSSAKLNFCGISKWGCPEKPALLMQAVQAASDPRANLEWYFRPLGKRKEYNVRLIAIAPEMVTIAYLMLKHNQSYWYAKDELIKKKLADCCRQGQGAVGKTWLSEDLLDNLYRQHGLPPSQSPSEWSAGERRALKIAEVNGFAKATHRKPEPKKTLRRKPAKTTAPN